MERVQDMVWRSCLPRAATIIAFLTVGLAPHARAEGPPEWVTKGAGVFRDGSLYAVGLAKGKGGPPILSRAADARARANLAAEIKSRVLSMTEDFEKSTSATDELVTRVIVYEGEVEVTDLSGSPSSRMALSAGEKLLVVDGEGFGTKEPFKMKDPMEDWNGWADGAAANSHE